MKKKDCMNCNHDDYDDGVGPWECRECLDAQLDFALAEIDKWKIASGLEKNGDPEKVTPQYMERYWAVIAGKVDRLEDECLKLKQDNKKLVDCNNRFGNIIDELREETEELDELRQSEIEMKKLLLSYEF